jgi:alpha-tubulin suppressor-like RCC1 family protein
MLKSLLLTVITCSAFFSSFANAADIACVASGAAVAFKHPIAGTGLYGLCMIDTCSPGLELYKNKCYQPATPSWSLSARTLDRGDYSIVAYATLPRPLPVTQGSKSFNVVADGAISGFDYVLPSSQIVFEAGKTISNPFEIAIKGPSTPASQITFKLSIEGGSEMFLTLNEINQPAAVLGLSFQKGLPGAPAADITADTPIYVNVALDKPASKYFSTTIKVKVVKASGAVEYVNIVVPKNSTSVSLPFSPIDGIVSVTASPAKGIRVSPVPVTSTETYSIQYEAFPAQSAASALACAGKETVTRKATCMSSSGAQVNLNLCQGPIITTMDYLSIAGTKSTAAQNGRLVMTCLAGGTTGPQSLVCNENFHPNAGGSGCDADTYTALFSTPVDTKSTVVCSGTETITPILLTCSNNYGNIPTDARFCADIKPVDVTFKSKAGSLVSGIANGLLTNTCALGSAVPTQSVSCNQNFHAAGLSCVADTYTASFTDAINTKTAPCSGVATLASTLSACKNDSTGLNTDLGLNFCSAKPVPQTTFTSPLGNIPYVAANGAASFMTCQPGQTSGPVTIMCDNGYHESSGACVLDTYTAVFSTPVNTKTVACSGTETLTGSMTSCLDYNGLSVNVNKCIGQTAPSSTFNSPKGTIAVPATNGSIARTCDVGLTSGTDVLTCNFGFQLNPAGNACMITVTQVSAGEQLLCFIGSNKKIYCSGNNNLGQLGTGTITTGTNTTVTTPQAVSLNNVGAGKIAKSVSVGGSHACAIYGYPNNTTSDYVFCWGSNASGQVGVNSGNASFAEPQMVTLPGNANVKKVSVGDNHSCAIIDSGTLACWGSASSQQNGYTNDIFGPRAVGTTSGNGVVYNTYKEIASGSEHSCAIRADASSSIDCWGSNSFGQLGIGFATARSQTANPVLAGGAYSKLGLGSNHSCAIAGDGTLKCWGGNNYGQLGNGTKDTNPPAGATITPTAIISNAQYAEVSGKLFATCGITVLGGLECWGSSGITGALGNSPSVNSFVPAVIGSGYSALSVAQYYSCTINAGELKCWGTNYYGQFAAKNTTSKTPVTVDLTAVGL